MKTENRPLSSVPSEAGIAHGLVDFGLRALLPSSYYAQSINNKSPVYLPHPIQTVTGKLNSNPYGKARPLNISRPAIIIREPFYGYIR